MDLEQLKVRQGDQDLPDALRRKQNMIRKKGFTLVELLVVVAIITILASIVVPNVTGWIGKARVAKALSEIKNAELCLNKMLTDAQRSNFKDFFKIDIVNNNKVNYLADINAAGEIYRDAFYLLLRAGKDAPTTLQYTKDSGYPYRLNSEIISKLGTAYMDIGKDAWGNMYQFWAGPFRNDAEVPFLIREADLNLPPAPFQDTYGTHASFRKTIYIYSMGDDGISAQVIAARIAQGLTPFDDRLMDDEHMHGGDDINNWDNAQSWAKLYD